MLDALESPRLLPEQREVLAGALTAMLEDLLRDSQK
jgi:hypothetical protein